MNLRPPTLSLAPTATPAAHAERINTVAKQLEGQFARMLISSMRQASWGDALFPDENQTFRDMYDQQLATTLTQGKGLGLAPMIARQLAASTAPTETTAPAPVPVNTALSYYKRMQPAVDTRNNTPPSPRHATAQVPNTASASAADIPSTPQGFVAALWQHAQQAARELGVDPRALIAQAALETGWGKRLITRSEGGSAHNLFGIKATGWTGQRVRTTTHEYSNGTRRSERADFRAYDSPAESFADYVRLLKSNPRYQKALAAGQNIAQFAHGLQQAGYATDPGYAQKIARIATGPTLSRIIAALDPDTRAAVSARVSTRPPAQGGIE